MTAATQIATALRELAPGKQLQQAEVVLIDQIAALWAARGASQGESWFAGAVTDLKDETAFYAALRGSLFRGGLTPAQFEGVRALLAAMGGAGWRLSWTAYGFATPYLETARTMQPIHEYGSRAYLDKYDTGELARRLGNTPEDDDDGILYAGRGYVQLTGRANYRKAQEATGQPLLAQPDLAMQPDTAAKILTWGMETGAFTGRDLGDYLPERLGTVPQFTQARRIINGQDRAAEIAGFARQFQDALVAGGWA